MNGSIGEWFEPLVNGSIGERNRTVDANGRPAVRLGDTGHPAIWVLRRPIGVLTDTTPPDMTIGNSWLGVLQDRASDLDMYRSARLIL